MDSSAHISPETPRAGRDWSIKANKQTEEPAEKPFLGAQTWVSVYLGEP